MGPTGNYIAFQQIPDHFRSNEKLLVAQYDFSGIQRYLFGSGDITMEQDDVRRRSIHVEQLTMELSHRLEKAFPRNHYRILSLSSGKLICAFNRWTNAKKLRSFSDLFQRQVYAATAGGLEVYYAIVPVVVRSIDKITDGNDASGTLALLVNENKYHCLNLLHFDMTTQQDVGLGIDTLVPPSTPSSSYEGSAMAIKLDLDNLGSFFSQLRAFDQRLAASTALKSVLEHSLETSIYIGGDDIFAVAPLEDALGVVASMHQKILDGISTRPELALYRPHFGISGGISSVEFRSSRIPLIYYFSSSEDCLSMAKQHPGKNCVQYGARLVNWQQISTLSRLWDTHHSRLASNQKDRSRCLRDPKVLAQQLIALHRKRSILTAQEVTLLEQIR